jgi:tetratricopeptide (TPR) repeat protein
MIRLFSLVFCLAGVCAVFAEEDTAQAQPEPEVLPEQRCIDFYRRGEYEKASDCLNSLYITGAVKDSARLLVCYEHLGVCQAMLEKPEMAKAAFKKLLELNPDHELDPNVYLPEIISLYQIVKFERKTSLRVLILDTVPAYHRAFNYLPFGTPQFMNQHTVKGIVVAAVEVAALGLSVFAYHQEQSYYSSKYGFREEDVADARSYDRIHKASLGVFTVAIVYGLVDGLLNKRISIKK